jgi:hypothetical protein
VPVLLVVASVVEYVAEVATVAIASVGVVESDPAVTLSVNEKVPVSP